jgi:hypothetical protein
VLPKGGTLLEAIAPKKWYVLLSTLQIPGG